MCVCVRVSLSLSMQVIYLIFQGKELFLKNVSYFP